MSMRVHELASELGKTNKEIIQYLKTKGMDAKSHMSTVPDELVDEARRAYRNKKKSQEISTVVNEEKQEMNQEGAKAEAPKKKKNIIRVFHAQNASDGGKTRKKKPAPRKPLPKNPAAKQTEPKKTAAPAKAEPVKKEAIKTVKRAAESQPAVKPDVEKPVAKPAAEKPAAEKTVSKSAVEKQPVKAPQTRQENNVQKKSGEQSKSALGQDKEERSGFRQQSRTPNRGGQQGRGQGRSYSGGRNQEGRNQGERQNRSQNGQSRGGQQGRSQSDRGSSDRKPRQEWGDSGNFRDRNKNTQNRSNQQGRKYQDNKTRFDNSAFAADAAAKSQKESKRERDKKENKNRSKDREKNQSRRPNQNQGRRPNMRLPKALQKPPVQHKEEKKQEIREITLPEKLTIRELAEAMKMQPAVIVKKLFLEGTMVTVNNEIDFEKAEEIALSYDIIATKEEKVDVIEELLKEDEEDESKLVPRPPVVCVMGHVDHGKTSLLDAIRNTHVTDREAGGITQHIGAYVVTINGQKITFLDTPGHEAFTAMRMRGANSTDIAILVVAADDGVMPQTVEAISHAKAAGIEIVVAINKIDKPSANIERVKQELSEYELIPEDWGGSTIFVPVSAKSGEGIEELLDMLLLTAEVCELKANPNRDARGIVIEAELDKGKGPVATILVQKGTLHVGDFIAAGACSGKVRAMMDDKGRRVKEAGPSMPVEILGLGDVPNAGEILVAFGTDKEAKSFAATFVSENKNRLLEDTKARLSLDDLFSQIQAGTLKELPIIVKADVQGSVEAVKQSLVKLSNEEVVVKVIHGGVGAINESDVTLASTSNAIVIGFNVRPDATAKAIAEQENVDLRLYKVIYQAIEDVESAMKGMLDPIFEEQIIGHGEVRQTFKASGVGTIAGGYVLDGRFERNCKVRVTRDGEQIYEGALASLKRFKDDVKEVKAGYECGFVFENFNDVKEEDRVEAYIMVEVPR